VKVLVLNGPNLGMVGRREPHIYGVETLTDIEKRIRMRATEINLSVRCEQSNHEGRLIDLLEEEHGRSQGCLINPGGLSHTSVALLDALRGFPGPVVEVHLSNVHGRELFRRNMLTAQVATATVTGMGADGYLAGLEALGRLMQTELGPKGEAQ
jgi:3-dehydroquinate dehydratase-2